MFYLTTHSTPFIYGYMALIQRKRVYQYPSNVTANMLRGRFEIDSLSLSLGFELLWLLDILPPKKVAWDPAFGGPLLLVGP